ncbi:MAG: hypothetical protein DBX59_07945 [Bacillota bacterium]|nr:MAG: hypothetical protein DBX59_07945 [Bacillota bacterium]
MLTKNEDKIMNAIYGACTGKTCCLLSPDDILSMAGVRGAVGYGALDKILQALEYDDYFELILSDRRGEKVYCITLKERGLSYRRQKVMAKRNLGYRLAVTVAFAFLSFLLGLLLKAIFT